MGDLVKELLALLRTIPDFRFVTVWNNQFNELPEGDNWTFDFPCLFVEIQSDQLLQIGQNYQGSDLPITIHIGQTYYNGMYMDEDLTIFDLRDIVVKKLANFQPATGSKFMKTAEQQDFEHTNIYHYTISYITHWIDATAAADEVFTTNNIDVVFENVTITKTADTGNPQKGKFIIEKLK